MMSKKILAIAVAFSLVSLPAVADWMRSRQGEWPKDWPAELEPLRKQSRTLTGGLANLTFHEIPFNKRDTFEAAWPQILKTRSRGTPITLFRGPHEYLGKMKAGVRIWHPAYETRNIWLVVDGDVVDLNRIVIPPNTEIIDRRFESD